MRVRFEHAYGDGRFCELTLDGTTVTARSGKQGGDGRVTSKEHASEAAAADDVAKRSAKLERDGFRRVPSPAAEPSHEALEKQIIESGDPEHRAVYADWLLEIGAPRGELAAIHRASFDQPRDRWAAEEPVFAKHPELRPARFGPIARMPVEPIGHRYSTAWWDAGFIVAARIARLGSEQFTVRELAWDLLEHPAARLLRDLKIGTLGGGATDYAPVVDVIARVRPAALRTLAIVDLPPGSPELAEAELGPVAPLLAALPELLELRLAAATLELGRLASRSLRKLAVSTPSTDVFRDLARADLPELDELALDAADTAIPDAIFEAAVAGPLRPRRLALTRLGNANAVVPRLVRAPLLEQVESLDLSGSKLGDVGAQALLDAPASLQALDVTRCALGAEMLARLGARFALTSGVQRAANPAFGEVAIRALVGDVAGLRDRAQMLATPRQWPRLGRAGETYWGLCRGSSNGYEVHLDARNLASGCTCASRQRPCKHVVALALVVAAGHPIRTAELPDGLVERCNGRRYEGTFE